MECSKCGAQLDATASFCMSCGTPVPQQNFNAPPPAPQPQVAPQPEPVQQPQPVDAVPYGAPNSYGSNEIQLNYLNAKEYINSSSTCRTLSIIAIICIFLTQPIDIAGIVCAIVALSKVKKLPEVRAELLNPQNLYAFQKAEREAETARKISKAAIIIEIVWLALGAIIAVGGAILAAMGVALPFLPFITDFIETLFM